MLKKILLCTAAGVAVATSSAFAADMPVKAPLSPAPPAWSWTGFYIGAHGGYGWKRNDFQEFLGTVNNVQFFVGDVDSNGWVAGGHVGYNWQRGSFVGGIELDMSATGIDGSSTPAVLLLGGGVSQTISREDEVKWLGSARARFGWTPQTTAWPFWIYGTGGLAWERFQRINNTLTVAPGIVQAVTTTIPNDRFGWVVGVGGEVRLSGNWLARLEYLHYEFGTSDTSTVVTTNVAGGSFAETNHNQKIDIVRAGVSYKF